MVQKLYSEKEPLWTSTDIEKFWKVIESYLSELLRRKKLPGQSIDFTCFDAECLQDYKLCLMELHDSLWKGRYSEAVANFRVMTEFFDKKLQYEEGLQSIFRSYADELRALKKIFCKGSR